MGKGGSKGSVQWFRPLEGGGIGCHECDQPATRWMDMERYGMRRWLSTAYCGSHGDWQMKDPHHTMREREIRN